VRLVLLTWNLYHGRSAPPCGRDPLDEYAATLAGWDWEVALLQEVPPWWPPELAHAAGAESRSQRVAGSPTTLRGAGQPRRALTLRPAWPQRSAPAR